MNATIIAEVKEKVDLAIWEYLEKHILEEQLEATTGWSARLVGDSKQLEKLGFERTDTGWQLTDFGQGTTDDREALARGGDIAECWLDDLGYDVRVELKHS